MDHPLRAHLANELHARPFLRIAGSVALTHYAIYAVGDTAVHHSLLKSLCELTGLPEPAPQATHYNERWVP
ncbi:putative membrane-anchored protein [Paraburkholderia sp. UCT70]